MKWKTETPVKPEPQSHVSVGDPDDVELRLTVVDMHQVGRQWQYLAMSFGAHSNESHDACCVTWPAEAIARARKLLDELEKQCEEPTNTPVANNAQIQ